MACCATACTVDRQTCGMSLESRAVVTNMAVMNCRKQVNQSKRNTRPLFRLGKFALMAQPAACVGFPHMQQGTSSSGLWELLTIFSHAAGDALEWFVGALDSMAAHQSLRQRGRFCSRSAAVRTGFPT